MNRFQDAYVSSEHITPYDLTLVSDS